MREHTDFDLEEIMKLNKKELLTTVDLNNIQYQMNYKFKKENQEEELEENQLWKNHDFFITNRNYIVLSIDES